MFDKESIIQLEELGSNNINSRLELKVEDFEEIDAQEPFRNLNSNTQNIERQQRLEQLARPMHRIG